MNPTSPLPAFIAILLAVTTAYLLAKRFGSPPPPGRYGSIDGLRGYLALGVFLYHSCVWGYYSHTGKWGYPPSRFYVQLGDCGIALFFMITGFLFFSKILDGRTKPIDWLRLYVSRFLRLTPLYLFVVVLLFIVVIFLSHGVLRAPLVKTLRGAACWLAFTIPGEPDLNGVKNTSIIMAGVTWTLLYEWLFYALLPVLALMVRAGVSRWWLLVPIATIVVAVFMPPQFILLAPFLSGMLAAGLVRWPAFRTVATGKVAAVCALASVVCVVVGLREAFEPAALLLLSLGFILIACGNSLFGLLTTASSRLLGEMAYSLYLLHGMILFVLFNFVIGLDRAKTLSPTAYWLVILGLTPLMVLICFTTFRRIEHPAMQKVGKVTAWLRARGSL